MPAPDTNQTPSTLIRLRTLMQYELERRGLSNTYSHRAKIIGEIQEHKNPTRTMIEMGKIMFPFQYDSKPVES